MSDLWALTLLSLFAAWVVFAWELVPWPKVLDLFDLNADSCILFLKAIFRANFILVRT